MTKETCEWWVPRKFQRFWVEKGYHFALHKSRYGIQTFNVWLHEGNARYQPPDGYSPLGDCRFSRQVDDFFENGGASCPCF